MTRTTEALFEAVLDKVRELFPGVQPSHFITDFEKTPANDVREVFSDQLTVSWCWFQAVTKRFKKNRFVGRN